jgi:hypothetical protein
MDPEILHNLLERIFDQFEEPTPGKWIISDETDDMVLDEDRSNLLEEIAEYLYRGEADAIEG